MNMRMPALLLALLIFQLCQVQGASDKQMLVFGNLSITKQNEHPIVEAIRVQRQVDKDDLTLVFMGGFTDEIGKLDSSVFEAISEQAKKIFLVPGENEWLTLGVEGIREIEEDFKKLVDGDVIIPDKACGEIETKDLGEFAEIFAIDSEWLLQDWTGKNNLNEDCIIKDRDVFYFHLTEEISGTKEKLVILLMYHPPFRFDRKSGHHSFKNHVFPFTTWSKDLYLPFPLAGTFILQTQNYLRSSKYLTHPRYRDLSSKITKLAKDHKKVLVLSADGDHTNVTTNKGSHFINITSSGSQVKPVLKNDGDITNEPSFLSIIVKKGSYDYQVLPFNMSEESEIFSGGRTLPALIADELSPDSLEKEILFSSVTVPIFEPGTLPELKGDYFTGELHTGMYTMPINAEVLDLCKPMMLTPTKIGGGHQTISVRLEDKDENEYVARSLRKNPSILLPSILRRSFAKDLVEYYFTAANPFSFLPINILEDRAGLYHTDPKLMFLPYQKQLSPYNDEVGNQLVLFSDRDDGDRSDSKSLKYSPNIISTEDMIEEFLENDLKVSSEYFLRNRLLDLAVGDWDRHEDQWRWAEQAEDTAKLKTFFPVARDRDQAMSNFDGLFLAVARMYNPSIQPMRPFDSEETASDIKWHSISANRLDQLLLTHINQESWMKIAREMQQSIGDQDIDDAVNSMPHEVSTDFKEDLKSKLSARFRDLHKTASLFYQHINRDLYLFASTSSDSILINSYDQDHLRVVVKSKNDDDLWFVKLERIIENTISKKIHIFGLEGDDVFIVANNFPQRAHIKLVGGFGDDQYLNMDMRPRRIAVMEVLDEDVDQVGSKFKKFYTRNRDLESFTKNDLQPAFSNITPEIRFDRDDAVFLGLTGQWFKRSFKKSTKHYLGADFAARRKSAHFRYGFEVENELRHASTFFEFNTTGPRYSFNYYGLGNSTTLDQEQPRSFYYVRQQQMSAQVGKRWRIGELGHFSAALRAERILVDTSIATRFINHDLDSRSALGPNLFAGMDFTLDFRNFNSKFRPTDGTYLGMDVHINKGIDNGKDHILLNPYYGLYKSIDHKARYIFTTKLQFQTILGNYFFYHAPNIGGVETLRGYRNDRFRGKSALSQNTNLHVKLFEHQGKGFIPLNAGVTGSFDYGRVWLPSEESNHWYTSWGAGIWVSPLKVFIISASVHKGNETTELRAKIGWQL